MYVDSQLQFCTSQAFATTGALSENVIDLGVARNLSGGKDVEVMFHVEVAADQGTGDEDYTFTVEYASDAAITTDVQVLATRTFESGTPGTGSQDADLLVAGYAFTLPVPSASLAEAGRYIGVRALLAGTTPTITVSAQLQPAYAGDDPKDNYASGYTVG